MSTPVFVAEARGATEGTMAFVVPRTVAASGAPPSTSEQVALRTEAPRGVACLRFRGYRDGRRIREAERLLRAWMHEHGLCADGPPRFAYYDPPWTPGVLRRNEIQILLHRRRPADELQGAGPGSGTTTWWSRRRA